LLNPFRLFETVKVPSDRADTLIQYAGVCAAAAFPGPRPLAPAAGCPVAGVAVPSGEPAVASCGAGTAAGAAAENGAPADGDAL